VKRLTLSDDGRSLYAPGPVDNAIVTFRRGC
jgi:hypothetical protein